MSMLLEELQPTGLEPKGDPGDDNFQIQISHNDFNQCDDNKMSPCLNGGTCIDGHMNYTCICKIGYLGDRCAEKVRPSCSIGTPCSNHNQKCIQLNNTHHRCDCITGYNGPNCMESVCEPNPCLNGAECIIVTKARCICENGYRGPFCQSHVCQVQNPCRNGGTCISITRWPGYDCTCTSGYRGDTCSAVRSYYKKKPQPLGSRVIAGIVFASLFGAAAIIVALFFIIRRYRKPPSSPYREPNSIGYGTHTWQNANDHIHPPVRDHPTLTPEQTHRAEIRGMLRDLGREGNQSNANRIDHNSTSQPTTRELNPIRSVNLDNNSLPVRYDPNGSPPDYTEALDDRYKLPSPEITEEPPPSYDTVHLNALRLENDFYPRALNNEHSNASSSEQRTLRGGSTENNNNEELNSDVQSPQTTDQSDSPRSPGNNTQINLNTLAMPTRNIHDTTVNTVNSNPAVIDNVPIEDLEETIL
ncbi:unnamed protein product [Owenia fusiformis]|uniref:EGF-like domain-containing protein n=1 Tax=Owenia fusiformis TaxID=6347 RepID=A0A8S4Q4Q8_OWEFU|nr:unnamed protein product [Owenia fusiformis]